MRRAARYGPLLAIATLAVAGCGSSGSDLPKDIPPAASDAMQRDLTRADQACSDGLTSALRRAAADYSAEVEALPSSVDGKVMAVLRGGARRLESLAETGTGCGSGATGSTGPTGAVPSTSETTTAPTHTRPKPTPKPQPKPKPKPTSTTESTATQATTTSTTRSTTSSTAPTTGGGGGTTTTGGGSSGGVGVGPGKDSRN